MTIYLYSFSWPCSGLPRAPSMSAATSPTTSWTWSCMQLPAGAKPLARRQRWPDHSVGLSLRFVQSPLLHHVPRSLNLHLFSSTSCTRGRQPMSKSTPNHLLLIQDWLTPPPRLILILQKEIQIQNCSMDLVPTLLDFHTSLLLLANPSPLPPTVDPHTLDLVDIPALAAIQ